MKAVIIGASGATGKKLVDILLADKQYQSLTIFVRNTTTRKHPKLIEHVIDFSKINDYAEHITGDVIFSCIGTTLSTAGSKENQWKVDFDIPAKFAKIARENNIHSFVLVSSFGASAESKVFYSMIKGRLEDRISELCFEQYIIFRPGALIRPDSDRLGEKIAVKLLEFTNKTGLLKKYRPLEVEILADKLAKAPKAQLKGEVIIELDKIFNF